jgi:DNA-binding response OmpR family regulator
MPTAQTVLVVEDDDAILESINYQLSRAGYRVLRATDGNRACACSRASGPTS